MKFAFVLLLFLPLCIGWWPFDEEETETNEDIKPEDRLVPFEITTMEQKFLQEANELLQLSPLDYCQHKVSPSIITNSTIIGSHIMNGQNLRL